MTSLVPQAGQTVEKAKSLTDALKTLANRKPAASPQKASEAPRVVPVSPEAFDAISRLSDELRAVELPSERRSLTVQERVALMELADDAKKAKQATEDAVAAVKTAVFNHFDVGLEEDEDALPLDAKGEHYLVAEELPVPGTGKKFVRQLAESAPQISAPKIKKLWDEGKISRSVYYRITRQPVVPREVDEEGLLDELKRNPELFSVLGEAITPGRVTASFWIRDTEGDD
jgi:hypothetical protein